MDKKNWRYTHLLVSIVLLFAVSSLVSSGSVTRYILSLLILATLVASVRVLGEHKTYLRILQVFAVVGFTLQVYSSIRPSASGSVAALVILTTFFFLVTYRLTVNIYWEETVTLDTIIGAVCVFLLVGISFSFIYGMIEILSPGSFSASTFDLPDYHTSEGMQQGFAPFLYFSFITLTTVGYGDFTPLHNVARTLAVLEGIFGQFYMAVMVARLVAMEARRGSGGVEG